MTITLFAVVGTLISFSIISLGRFSPSLNFTRRVDLCSPVSPVQDVYHRCDGDNIKAEHRCPWAWRLPRSVLLTLSINLSIKSKYKNFHGLLVVLAFDSCMFNFSALGAIFSATDSVCTLQVLSQDETPFLYSLVFGEGVVNDATSVVLFNAIQNFDLGNFSSLKFLQFIGNFLYLFGASTFLGVAVSSVLFQPLALSTCQVLFSYCICVMTTDWTSQCLCHQETVLWQVGTLTH